MAGKDADYDLALNSELGTKEYWDRIYKKDLKNFKNFRDIGEVWYGEESIDRVLCWMDQSPLVCRDSTIVDVGCGNGAFLLSLAAEGYQHLTGVDYSQPAITLARNICQQKGFTIDYKLLDATSSGGALQQQYDVCHDKGTYDSASLHPTDTHNYKRTYLQCMHDMLKPGGLYIISSCNWTKDEIVSSFSDFFEFLHEIPTPKFMFGGIVGSCVTQLVLTRSEAPTVPLTTTTTNSVTPSTTTNNSLTLFPTTNGSCVVSPTVQVGDDSGDGKDGTGALLVEDDLSCSDADGDSSGPGDGAGGSQEKDGDRGLGVD